MSYRVYWKFTNIPEKIVDIIDTELMNSYGGGMGDSRLIGDKVDPRIRNSKNGWVPHEHWSAGVVWHYINMINIKSLGKKVTQGIPFSALKKNDKRTQKRKRSRSRKRKRRTKRKPIKIPPRGVIIRKKDKLYKSDGKQLILIE